jgi:hypothetical protein
MLADVAHEIRYNPPLSVPCVVRRVCGTYSLALAIVYGVAEGVCRVA